MGASADQRRITMAPRKFVKGDDIMTPARQALARVRPNRACFFEFKDAVAGERGGGTKVFIGGHYKCWGCEQILFPHLSSLLR
jgi:hypothetical protein